MISAFHYMKRIRRLHLLADFVEQVGRTKRITCSLNKQNRRLQFAQNFIPQFCSVAHRTEWITEANQASDLLFQRNVTANPPTHAFPDQEYLAGCFLA